MDFYTYVSGEYCFIHIVLYNRDHKYIFSLPPEHLLPFFEDYLEDEDEIDPKAGGGDPMTIGQMVNSRDKKYLMFEIF